LSSAIRTEDSLSDTDAFTEDEDRASALSSETSEDADHHTDNDGSVILLDHQPPPT